MSQRSRAVLPLLFLFLTIGAFATTRVYNLITGPKIKVESPTDGALLKNDLVEIIGKAQNSARIFLNGRQIFTDENGVFKEKLLVHYGYNIITLTGEDKFNKQDIKTLRLIYQ